MLLWYGDGDNDAVSLGNTLQALQAFAEIARVLGDDPDYQELQSVPGFAEQTVTPWWLGQVKQQARRYLREHTARGAVLDVLQRLSEDIPQVHDVPS